MKDFWLSHVMKYTEAMKLFPKWIVKQSKIFRKVLITSSFVSMSCRINVFLGETAGNLVHIHLPITTQWPPFHNCLLLWKWCSVIDLRFWLMRIALLARILSLSSRRAAGHNHYITDSLWVCWNKEWDLQKKKNSKFKFAMSLCQAKYLWLSDYISFTMINW